MFRSPTFLALKSSFFPASLKYFHLWIFGTEKKNSYCSPCSPLPSTVAMIPQKITKKSRVAMLAIYEPLRRIRGIEVWKLRDDWQDGYQWYQQEKNWLTLENLRRPGFYLGRVENTKRNLSKGPRYIHRFVMFRSGWTGVFLRNSSKILNDPWTPNWSDDLRMGMSTEFSPLMVKRPCTGWEPGTWDSNRDSLVWNHGHGDLRKPWVVSNSS